MIRPGRRSCKLVLSLALSALLAAVLLPGPLAASRAARKAAALYEAGNYDEARPLLEEIAAGKKADGLSLYRLYYVQALDGDPAADATLNRAIEQLERELPDSDEIEIAFYLANAYLSQSRGEDLRRVAAFATTRVESGEIDVPETAEGLFRVGKLYDDQERPFEASDWYERSLADFDPDETDSPPPYVEHAARTLADRAYDDQRFQEAAHYLGILDRVVELSIADLDRLGNARARVGEYEGALDAWLAAKRKNPAGGNPFRYKTALARQAAKVGALPIAAPDDRSWDKLDKTELETTMNDLVQTVRDLKTRFEENPEPTREEWTESSDQVETVKPIFLAAALEYALRGLSIREAAFFGGYSPLIFHPREWRLTLPGREPRTGRGYRQSRGEQEPEDGESPER